MASYARKRAGAPVGRSIELSTEATRRISALVNKLVADAGGTNTALADRIQELSASTIGTLRKGHRQSINPATLEIIARASKVTSASILDGQAAAWWGRAKSARSSAALAFEGSAAQKLHLADAERFEAEARRLERRPDEEGGPP